MNAIITLPSASIRKINEEQKDILILNAYPDHFDVKKDWLFMLEKETAIVVGGLTIKSAFQCTEFISSWWKIRKRIAHKDKSWLYYTFICKKFFVFKIGKLQMFDLEK